MNPNRPTELGKKIGAVLAHVADEAEAKMLASDPNARVRCASCAFRSDTIPNGCGPTLVVAANCIANDEEFMCHMDLDAQGEPQHRCAGWVAARMDTNHPAKHFDKATRDLLTFYEAVGPQPVERAK